MWSSGSLAADWAVAEPHIVSALAHCGDTHKPADVLAMINRGEAALYVGKNSAVVTQEIDLPVGTQLHFWLAAGDLGEMVEMERDIERAARSRGIRRLSILGRRGWKAALDGFREAGTILVKEIA
jgi:hypothetical protein